MSESLPVKREADTRPTTPEVEFALVLSRLIESAQSDPSQLRSSIYQIARIKLREQVAPDDPEEAQRLLQALETAINGVEDFSQRQADAPKLALLQSERPDLERPSLAGPSLAGPSLAENSARPRLIRGFLRRNAATIDHDTGNDAQERKAFSGFKRLSFVARSLGMLIVIGAVIYFAFDQRRELPLPAGQKETGKPSPARSALPFGDKWAPMNTAEPASTKDGAARRQLLPDRFGVFAVSANELHELEQLPGRAPDPRVAISAAIAQPAKATIADGQVRFVVHRRDSATIAAERAEVRVVARLGRASPEAPGKSAPAQAGENWVIRNISHPFRAAPIRDAADMYELRSDDPALVLTPGRYALVIKGAAYDFAVRGDITDPKQCLERTQAANGVFYTECRKP